MSLDSISNVVGGGYCVGCGACVYNKPDTNMVKDEYGLLKPLFKESDSRPNDSVCPFSSDINEDALGKSLYSESNTNYEKRIGYYQKLYAGHVATDGFRERGSSGGMVSWIVEELFHKGFIDGVIHVGNSSTGNDIFSYKVSHSIAEMRENAKSKYYPTSFDQALEHIKNSNKKYAFVGIPCYIKAARLLCVEHAELNDSIKFFIGIFCGHLKSAAFAELLGWQQGVSPKNLVDIDFRVKTLGVDASNYSIKAEAKNKFSATAKNSELYGTDWGLGLFKPKACEWCDDISAETADIVLGDAWLPEYTSDSMGTNVIIVRNSIIGKMIADAESAGKLTIDPLTVDKIIQSQAANYRHRQEGLSVRIEDANSKGIWHPRKRVNPEDYSVSTERKKIYLHRMLISEKSHEYFLEAKKKNSILYFILRILPLELKYYYLNNNLIKRTIKSSLIKLKILTNSIRD